MTRHLRWSGSIAALRQHELALKQHPPQAKLKPPQATKKRKRRKLRRRARPRPTAFEEFDALTWRHLQAIWNPVEP